MTAVESVEEIHASEETGRVYTDIGDVFGIPFIAGPFKITTNHPTCLENERNSREGQHRTGKFDDTTKQVFAAAV